MAVQGGSINLRDTPIDGRTLRSLHERGLIEDYGSIDIYLSEQGKQVAEKLVKDDPLPKSEVAPVIPFADREMAAFWRLQRDIGIARYEISDAPMLFFHGT